MSSVFVTYKDNRPSPPGSTNYNVELLESLRKHGFTPTSTTNMGCVVPCEQADVDRLKLIVEVHDPGASFLVM